MSTEAQPNNDAAGTTPTIAADELREIVESVLAEVPDALRALIPAELTDAQKLRWFKAAKASGVFAQKAPVSAPDARRPNNHTREPSDYGSLPPIARIASGYNR